MICAKIHRESFVYKLILFLSANKDSQNAFSLSGLWLFRMEENEKPDSMIVAYLLMQIFPTFPHDLLRCVLNSDFVCNLKTYNVYVRFVKPTLVAELPFGKYFVFTSISSSCLGYRCANGGLTKYNF